MVSPGDCILAYSTSGKTREVLEFIELSGISTGTTRWVPAPSSASPPTRTRGRELADVIIDMGVIEPCPLGLTPRRAWR